MLNPTGLLSSPVSLGPQNIGESLQERRDWLAACLNNWNTFYGSGNQADPTNRNPRSSSGALLYHLAIMALHLNFSDLHVVAGRSGSDADIELAKQSLRNWLQGERAQKIFECNTQMLNVSHDAIAAGNARQSGFELAICLFMGGLTSWAMSHFGGLRISSRDSEHGNGDISHHQDNSDMLVEDLSGTKTVLDAQVLAARDGLRALKFLRLAVAFGDILDRLHTAPP